MQVRLRNTSAATETAKPEQGKDTTATHGATTMPGGSNSVLARLRRSAPAERTEASVLGRPHAPLKALARAGLGLATFGVAAAALTGCSSGTSGVAVGSSTPSAPPPSSAQSIDPAPTDSATASTATTDPSAAASSPTDIPSIAGQPGIDVTQAQMQLDLYAGMEADAIASAPRPTDNILGKLHDRIGTDSSNLNGDYGTLLNDLNLYLTEEEDRINSGKNIPPESASVQQIRGQRMTQNVQYWEAMYRQNPTQDNYAELAAAQNAVTTARNDNLIPKQQQDDPLPDGWYLPN